MLQGNCSRPGGLRAVEEEMSLLPCVQTRSFLLALAPEAVAPRQALGSSRASAGSQALAGDCMGQVAALSFSTWAVAATGTVV